jgi:hypothetical protein
MRCFHYETGLIVTNGGYLLLHSRFIRGSLPANRIKADILCLKNNQLAEYQTSCETRPQRKHPRAVCPYSTTRSPVDELSLASNARNQPALEPALVRSKSLTFGSDLERLPCHSRGNGLLADAQG